jgi:hypothetical protein
MLRRQYCTTTRALHVDGAAAAIEAEDEAASLDTEAEGACWGAKQHIVAVCRVLVVSTDN